MYCVPNLFTGVKALGDSFFQNTRQKQKFVIFPINNGHACVLNLSVSMGLMTFSDLQRRNRILDLLPQLFHNFPHLTNLLLSFVSAFPLVLITVPFSSLEMVHQLVAFK